MATGAKATQTARPAMETKPPRALMAVMNPVVKVLLRSRLRGKMGDVLMLLTFTGRKSGKQFTTPVGYRQRGDTLLAFTDSPWGKNLEGGAPVRVVVQGKQMQGWAELITDKEAVLKDAQDFLRENGPGKARQLGLSLDKSRQPTEEELRVMLRDRVLIQINVGKGRKGPATGS